MIFKAKHNAIIYNFFKWYTGYAIKRNFNSVSFSGCIVADNRPILLLSNHISWWDGFWIMHLNKKRLNKKFYFMMLEEQLRKFWFFNYSGGFSINKNSRSIFETINYTANLLQIENNLVMVFPQGEINSMYQQNILFENGIERILAKTNPKPKVVFVANVIDYFSNSKPNLTVNYTEYEQGVFTTTQLQESYNAFYRKCVESQINTANK